MKTKRKAKPRVPSVGPLESADISASVKPHESYSVDLEGNALLDHRGDLESCLNVVTKKVCTSQYVASKVGSHISCVENASSVNKKKCDTFNVNEPSHCTLPLTDGQGFVPDTMPVQCGASDVISEPLQRIPGQCTLEDTHTGSTGSLHVHTSYYPNPASSADKGKQIVSDAEAHMLTSSSHISGVADLLCTEDLTVTHENHTTIIPERFTQNSAPLLSMPDSNAMASSSNSTPCAQPMLGNADNLAGQMRSQRRRSRVTMHSSSTRRQRRSNLQNRFRRSTQGAPDTYSYMGSCNQTCQHCNARFWYDERIVSVGRRRPEYHKCCNDGKVVLDRGHEYTDYIKDLFTNRHFMENIRAYNQMFAMTSLGAEVDNSINMGRGPYVFKISGQLYHKIGSLCPEENTRPQFLQLYIYDTENEVANRLENFQNSGHGLRADIVENLIHLLDDHNELVQLFRTARDKIAEADVPQFKVRLFGVVGSRQHELPAGDSIGAIVFEGGPDVETDFDVVIEQHDHSLQRVNKLNASYMSLQFPLIFFFGEDGYHLGRLLLSRNTTDDLPKKMTMKMYYSYELQDRPNEYTLLNRGGRLFQQYVVPAYCSIEQSHIDYIREHQDDIRNDYMAGLYDAISRGDRDGSDVGSRIILPSSFTGGPRYMYSHYLDALAICRAYGNPSFFITFTCNVNWPEIKEYMEDFPHVTVADRPCDNWQNRELFKNRITLKFNDFEIFISLFAISYKI